MATFERVHCINVMLCKSTGVKDNGLERQAIIHKKRWCGMVASTGDFRSFVSGKDRGILVAVQVFIYSCGFGVSSQWNMNF